MIIEIIDIKQVKVLFGILNRVRIMMLRKTENGQKVERTWQRGKRNRLYKQNKVEVEAMGKRSCNRGVLIRDKGSWRLKCGRKVQIFLRNYSMNFAETQWIWTVIFYG